MLRPVFFLITFLLLSTSSFGKGIPTKVEKIAITCRVWGFLKYYHSLVATGNYNWDAALIRILPIIEKADSWEELNEIGLNSIISLGPIPMCETCETQNPDWFSKNFDLGWTDNQNIFTEEMMLKFDYIEMNRTQKTSFLPSHELSYVNMEFPNEECRILELCRFWNIVEYHYPYKYLMDQEWDSTLLEFIPRFINAPDTLGYELCLVELVTRLNDSHSAYYSSYAYDNYFGNKFLPVNLRYVENKVIVIAELNGCDSIAGSIIENQELKVGDILLEIDGRKVSEIIQSRRVYFSGSNESVLDREVSRFLMRAFGDSVLIKYDRSGKISDEYIHIYQDVSIIPKEQDSWYRINNFGYVNLSKHEIENDSIMMKNLSQCDGIIFDLRNNSGKALMDICRYFYKKKEASAMVTFPIFTYPGNFATILQKYDMINVDSASMYNGELVLLVNEWTQSSGESGVMYMEGFNEVIIIGSQTAGADGQVESVKFLQGTQVYMTSYGYYYPNGEELQRIGIVPDIIVKPTIKGIREGRDEVLESALNYLANKFH